MSHNTVWVPEHIFQKWEVVEEGHWVCAAVYLVVAWACPCPVRPMPPSPPHAQYGQSGQSVTKSRPSWRPPSPSYFKTNLHVTHLQETLSTFLPAWKLPNPQRKVLVCQSQGSLIPRCQLLCEIWMCVKPQNLFVGTASCHPESTKLTPNPMSSLLKSQGSLIPRC